MNKKQRPGAGDTGSKQNARQQHSQGSNENSRSEQAPFRAADEAQITTFVEAIFKHAGKAGYVSLRAFEDNATNKVFAIRGVPLTAALPAPAALMATRAANAATAVVFCPPLAVFKGSKRARESDILKGLVLTVECDAHAAAARAKLEALLGAATVVVKSGGEWVDPATGELQPKLHLHWRLSQPVQDPTAIQDLKTARDLATALVGGDPTNKSVVHPIRWPGSWHCKAAPPLCEIETVNAENEIDLAAALAALQAASKSTHKDKSKSNNDAADIDDEDISKWPLLFADIIKGVNYHSSLTVLSAMVVRANMHSKAAANMLRGVMLASPAEHDDRWQTRYDDIDRTVRSAAAKYANKKPEKIDPVDLWNRFEPPPLPVELLPQVIGEFAIDQSILMGADPAGLAMAALTVCAAAIPDYIKLQPKKHDPNWQESTRLWAALVGDPATMKSPMLKEATKPLVTLDMRLVVAYRDQKAEYDALSEEEKKNSFAGRPQPTRLRLSDTTMEAAQEVLRDSVNGVLCLQDELSGWFGSMDKYSGHRGGMKDRGFWLQAYDGGSYPVNRIGRGNFIIPNLSVSMLGGIQPEPLRKLADDMLDDGLLQRLVMIMLRPAQVGRDEPRPGAAKRYAELVEQLNDMEERGKPFKFDDAALAIREQLEEKHIALGGYETINKKLASHIIKYNGLFARLCLLWHCIEHVNADGEIAQNYITVKTAQRVADFMDRFLLPHALAFYAGVLGLSDEHDRLTAVAGYILARQLPAITNRHVQRGDRTMRGLHKPDVDKIFQQLQALGWLIQGDEPPPPWEVNPAVHRKFAARAVQEAARRRAAQEMITERLKTKE